MMVVSFKEALIHSLSQDDKGGRNKIWNFSILKMLLTYKAKSNHYILP